MTKYSLRARMLSLILAPTLLIALLLITFFVMHRYNQLQQQVISTGFSIIEPLAIASEYGIKYNNHEKLQRIIWQLHRQHANIVHDIAIFNQQNRLIVNSDSHYNPAQLQLPPNSAPPTKLTLTKKNNYWIVKTPILNNSQFKQQNDGLPVDPLNNYLGYVSIKLDLSKVKQQQYQEVMTAILMILLCLSIAMLFAYRLMRDVTGPIHNMVNMVDRIRQGQLNMRIAESMPGELEMLKNGINDMAISLADYHQEQQQHIDQATSDLRKTLKQMEVQNIELALSKKKAQEAARIKSEFLANMSHELRTPLNGVIGFSRQILKTTLTPIQVEYINTIERSASNLLNIINDVLDYSKLEAGKLLLESIPFSLHKTVDELTMLLSHSAHEKGLEMILDIYHDVPEFLLGDPLHLQQILTNLIGNAIKFTESGEIIIRIKQNTIQSTSTELEIQVHDTGIGIMEQQQSELFQAFRQADASISRSHGGTGLGLVITQKLLQEMGGKIDFHSQPNQGSVFCFNLQLRIDPYHTIDNAPGAQLASLEGRTLLYIEANHSAAQATLTLLKQTPLEIYHYRYFEQAPINTHFDILLLGIPATLPGSLSEHCYFLMQEPKVAKRTILLLPTQFLSDSELQHKLHIEQIVIKPIVKQRLFSALLTTSLDPSLSATQHKQPSKQVTTLLPLKVMAVDDNPANLKLIGALLQEKVQQIILSSNAEEAIAIARQQQLDLILMDIQMPKIDGIRAAELIRKLPSNSSLPIIAVTANVGLDEKARLLQAGMDDYLPKPIDEKMLDQILLRYLSISSTTPAPSDVPSALEDHDTTYPVVDRSVLTSELFDMLLEFLPEVKTRVQLMLQGKQDHQIIDIIHKLHGSCSFCNVPHLQQICRTIEQQLRAGIEVTILEPEWLELLDEIENIQQAKSR